MGRIGGFGLDCRHPFFSGGAACFLKFALEGADQVLDPLVRQLRCLLRGFRQTLLADVHRLLCRSNRAFQACEHLGGVLQARVQFILDLAGKPGHGLLARGFQRGLQALGPRGNGRFRTPRHLLALGLQQGSGALLDPVLARQPGRAR